MKYLKRILVLLLFLVFFAGNCVCIHATGSGEIPPLSTQSPDTSSPGKSSSDKTSKNTAQTSTPQPSTVERAVKQFDSFDDMIDYFLDEYYKDRSTQEKSDCKVLLSLYTKKAKKKLMNDYYNARHGDSLVIAEIEKCFKSLDKGTKVIRDGSYDINSSESMAVGDMYAPDETNGITVDYQENAEWVEEQISKVVINLGNGFNSLVENCRGTLDKLVYGRLVYYGTNYYCFELVKGNPYGIVGSYVYKLFRNLVIPLLLILLFSKFTKAAWNSGSGEQRRLFKDAIGRTILMLLLVFLMPIAIDALIALKDIVLNYISDELGNSMSDFFGIDPGNNTTIIGYYKQAADDGHKLLDALLYLGVSFISIFYMVTYISTAIAVMVSFMFFPLIIIFSFTDNKMVDMWFKQMIGDIFVPVLDAVLLLMPLMLKTIIGDDDPRTYLIAFIACYSVIPSRAVIRSMLGVGGSMRSELLGFGALMGTMRMMSGIKNRVTGGVKGLWGAHKQNKADREMSDMYADLARANGEGDQLTGKFAKLGKLSSTEGKDEKNEAGGLSQTTMQSTQLGEEKGNADGAEDKPLQDENGQPMQKLDSAVSENENGNENEANGEDGLSDTVNASHETEKLESTVEGNAEDAGQAEEASLNGENIAAASANEDVANTGVDGAEGRTLEEQREIDKKNVLKGYVNTDNFENKEFKNCLNFAERAKLHRQRANRNAVYSTVGAVGSVAGGVGMGALGAAAFGGATMFAGSRVNMTAATAGANMGSAVGSHIGGTTGRTVGAMASGVHEVVKTGSSHPIRQSAARVGEMAIREAGVAPGVANKLYQTTEGYKTKPNDSTFAHRLAFDPSQTTVPQRRSVSSDGRPNTSYRNYYSPENINGYDIPSMPRTEVSTETRQLPKPDINFSTLDSSLKSLGLDNEQYKTQVDERIDMFANPESEKYQEYTEQLNRMKENHTEELEAKKAEWIQQMDEKAVEERAQKELERMEKNYKATIITRDMFRSSPNASSLEKPKQKFFKNPQKDDMEQLYKDIRKRL